MATTAPAENGTTPAPQQPEPQISPPAAAAEETPAVEITPATAETTTDTAAEATRWPGWPGDCVFRLIVPVLKVGSIIGRKGDLIKKLCEETRARVRVLEGPPNSTDRIVLISGQEEPDLALSPAMDAVMRISKRVNGLPESGEDVAGAVAVAFCSIRLLVAATQAINLIGRQGNVIRSIQESTGASVRVLSAEESPNFGNSDERVVDLQGEALKVLKALEAVVGHLRKFLVDHSVLPLFEKSYAASVAQDRPVETWADKPTLHTSTQNRIGSDFSLALKRESLFLDRESNLESRLSSSSGLSLYGQDTGISGLRSSGLGRVGGPIVTQVAQTMQIPLAFVEDIIGIGGSNIAYIRKTSGAILTVQESSGLPEEINVEIKGTASQVQTAQQLIQESVNSHKDVVPNSYGNIEPDSRSSYSQLDNSSYSSSSFGSQQYGQQYGRYGSSGLGGYNSNYRM